jgi:hypothetical protein
MDLNYVLLNINTAALVEVAGHHTMELLTSPQQRLPELRIVTRSVQDLPILECPYVTFSTCLVDPGIISQLGNRMSQGVIERDVLMQGGSAGCATEGGDEASPQQTALGHRDSEGDQGHGPDAAQSLCR